MSTGSSELGVKQKAGIILAATLWFCFAAQAMRAQAVSEIPAAARPTSVTYNSLVYGADPGYTWILIKWGAGKNAFVRPQILSTTRIFENGQPAPKSALCPTPQGLNCGNVTVQVVGFYYGNWMGLATKFYASTITILNSPRIPPHLGPSIRPTTLRTNGLNPYGSNPPPPASGPPPMQQSYGRPSSGGAPPPTVGGGHQAGQGNSGEAVNGIRIRMRIGAGRCVPGNPTREHFVGSLYVSATGVIHVPIEYRWIRSDGATGQTVSVNVTNTHQLNLRDEWDLYSPHPSGWEAVEVISLNSQTIHVESNHATFACPGGSSVPR